MVSAKLEVDDVVILLLGAPAEAPSLRGKIEGVTRLEKLVFLLERESPVKALISEEADFFPHNFGPFSSKVYQAVDTLAAAGLLEDSGSLSETSEDSWEKEEIIGESAPDPYATRDFTLTERGRRYYEVLVSELPDGTEAEMSRFKGRFGAIPLRQLVRYVYERYPEMTKKSVIRHSILGS